MNRELIDMGLPDVKTYDVWTFVIKDTSAFLAIAAKISNLVERHL